MKNILLKKMLVIYYSVVTDMIVIFKLDGDSDSWLGMNI